MNKPKITYRGWPGHFILGYRCIFRLNTLVEFEHMKVVVSTVGQLRHEVKGQMKGMDTIGGNGRYYETMAFWAIEENGYWDADVTREFEFKSPWSINAESEAKLPENVDNVANEMHETVVKEVAKKLTNLAIEIPF